MRSREIIQEKCVLAKKLLKTIDKPEDKEQSKLCKPYYRYLSIRSDSKSEIKYVKQLQIRLERCKLLLRAMYNCFNTIISFNREMRQPYHFTPTLHSS